jgi:hypothetical protein
MSAYVAVSRLRGNASHSVCQGLLAFGMLKRSQRPVLSRLKPIAKGGSPTVRRYSSDLRMVSTAGISFDALRWIISTLERETGPGLVPATRSEVERFSTMQETPRAPRKYTGRDWIDL